MVIWILFIIVRSNESVSESFNVVDREMHAQVRAVQRRRSARLDPRRRQRPLHRVLEVAFSYMCVRGLLL